MMTQAPSDFGSGLAWGMIILLAVLLFVAAGRGQRK